MKEKWKEGKMEEWKDGNNAKTENRIRKTEDRIGDKLEG